MKKYHGVLQTKGQALAWAKKLRKNGIDKHIGAAQILEKNWHYIATRPALAIQVMAMVESDPINIEREGSILNILVNKEAKHG